jgi:hypothetical protein
VQGVVHASCLLCCAVCFACNQIAVVQTAHRKLACTTSTTLALLMSAPVKTKQLCGASMACAIRRAL